MSNEVDSTHTVFGLKVRSNLAVPGLVPLGSPSDAADVELHLEFRPVRNEGFQPIRKTLLTPALTPMNPAIRPCESGRTQTAAFSGWRITMAFNSGWNEKESPCGRFGPQHQLLRYTSYLLGPVFGLLLRLRGVTCLHASAVSLRIGVLCSLARKGRENQRLPPRSPGKASASFLMM